MPPLTPFAKWLGSLELTRLLIYSREIGTSAQLKIGASSVYDIHTIAQPVLTLREFRNVTL